MNDENRPHPDSEAPQVFPSAKETLTGALTGNAPGLSEEDRRKLKKKIRVRLVIFALLAILVVTLGFFAGQAAREHTSEGNQPNIQASRQLDSVHGAPGFSEAHVNAFTDVTVATK